MLRYLSKVDIQNQFGQGKCENHGHEVLSIHLAVNAQIKTLL